MADFLDRFPEFQAAVGRYRLMRGDRALGRCPNAARHRNGDRKPSLVMMRAENGGLIFHCLAGCPKLEVLLSVPGCDRMRPWRLVCHDRPLPKGGAVMRKVVKVYEYRDPGGQPWCAVARFMPKDFRPFRVHGVHPGVPAACGRDRVYALNAGWVKRFADPAEPTGHSWRPLRETDRAARPAAHPDAEWADGVTPWPYNADRLAAGKGRLVFFCEGEKDCDTLAADGFLAVTTQGGSGSRQWPPEWDGLFRGRHVLFVPDNDQAGEDYARWYAGCVLFAGAASVTRLGLRGLKAKGDVSDWFFARRRSAADVGPGSAAAAAFRAAVARRSGYARRKLADVFRRRGANRRPAATNGPAAGYPAAPASDDCPAYAGVE